MKQRYLILYNAITNYGRALIQGLVSFLLVPFIVGHIGSESYGVILLATAAYGMIALFGLELGKAVTKYYAQERAKEQTLLVNMIFNSSLLWFFIVGVLGSIATFILGLNFESIFSNVSSPLIHQGQVSMYIISFTIIPCIVLDVFRGILFGEQRYDIVNFIGTLSAVLRAVAIFCYFLFISPSLIAVVVIYSLFYIIERVGYVITSYRIIRNLKISFSFVTKQGLKIILVFASMMFIAAMVNILAGHVFKFIIGYKLSLKDLTYYGVLLLLTTTANLLVLSFVNVLVPVASRYQSLGEYSVVRKMLIHGTKYAVIIILALICITMPFLKSLLNLWMGPEFIKLWPIGIIMFIGQIFNSSAVAANQVLSGLGRVKVLALSSSISVMIGFGLSLFYLEFWASAVLFIAVTLLTTRELINAVIVVVYSIQSIGIDKKIILNDAYFFPLMVSLIVLSIGGVFVSFFNIDSWLLLIISVLCIEFIYFVLIYFFCLDDEEKILSNELLNKTLNKILIVKVHKNGIKNQTACLRKVCMNEVNKPIIVNNKLNF